MLRDVTRSPNVSSRNFATSSTPIECHITRKSLLRQEIVEKMTKVIVVGFAIERERAAVLIEHAKHRREPTEQIECGNCSFTFENVPKPQALPWQKAPEKVK
jgi:hypothetical protein